MSLVIKGQFGLIVDAVREKRPVIHHLTNYVTAGDCANITLCAGASPVMADEAEEVVEITSNADALVLNLGTIAKAKMQAMETAAAAAKNKGIAVVLDPVGVMASKLRLVFALKLLNEGLVTIVRGNYAECLALLEEKAEGRGVDSNGNVTDGLRVAKDAAEKYNCVFAVTGVTDYVSNGKQALVLTGGHELLTQITGAGCMTTTLCACCAAVTKDPLLAAALGIVIMGQAAELAAGFMETKDGPGMFKTRLFDGVYHVTTKWNVCCIWTRNGSSEMEKMKLKIDYSVYLVTDTGFLQGRDFAACIEAALKGGVTLLQYRDKNADSRVLLERALLLKKMCAVYHVPLLINDRLDIALAVQADGVHVGQSDLPVTVVRRLLGEQAVIGASAHNPEEARQALADGADYLGCGAVFGTTTKNDAGYLGLDGLQSIRQAVTAPLVGIGGVNSTNFEQVLQTGVNGAAIVSGILAADDIEAEVRKFKTIADRYKNI